jgi:hypothetical protein
MIFSNEPVAIKGWLGSERKPNRFEKLSTKSQPLPFNLKQPAVLFAKTKKKAIHHPTSHLLKGSK